MYRFMTGLMVWTSLLLIVLLFGGLFGLSLYKYITLKDLPDSQGNIFQINFTPDYFVDFINQAIVISIFNHVNDTLSHLSGSLE